MIGQFSNTAWGILAPISSVVTNVDVEDLFRKYSAERLKTKFCTKPGPLFLTLANELGAVDAAFDALGGLYVYHFAVSRYVSEANRCCAMLRKGLKRHPEMLGELFHIESGVPYRDRVNVHLLRIAYNQALAWIIEDRLPHAVFDVDKWGAMGYSWGTNAFYGDASNQFPACLNSASLTKFLGD